MAVVLAVDLGRTGCRAGVWTGRGEEPRATREVPGTPGLAAPGGAAEAGTVVLAIARELLRAAGVRRVDAVCVGAAGALAAPEAARALAGAVLAGLPAEETAVTSDAVTAHAGALGRATGVVLAAGTGAVAVGVGTGGTFAVVDGWGPWLGDEGGGAWIGTAGLRAALRAHDGRGEPTALLEAAVAEFGALSRLPTVLDEGGNPARRAASFAPAVARAAAEGDRAAVGILHSAATALSGAVAAAARRSCGPDPAPVVLTGGLVNLGAPLLTPLYAALAELAPALRPQPPLGDPLGGARLLALPAEGPHEPLITRLRR